MNRYKVLCEFIENYPCDEPIFVEDCLKYLKDRGVDKDNNKYVYVYLYRLIQERKVKKFSDGIYYKPSTNVFGESYLDTYKVINMKYLCKDNNVKGYYSGAYLFNKLGLTTQIPRYITIMTNECPNKNQYVNKRLNVIIKKPKIEVNSDNYLYLQLLDVLVNKDRINIEVDNEDEIINKYIEKYDIKINKLIHFAKMINSKRAMERIWEIAC